MSGRLTVPVSVMAEDGASTKHSTVHVRVRLNAAEAVTVE